MRPIGLLAAALLLAPPSARADETPRPPASSAPAQSAPAMKRESGTMMVTGMALTALGVIAGVTGVLWMAAANNGTLGKCGTTKCAPEEQRAGGAATAIAGGVSVAVGVPVWIYGARLVPAAPLTATGPVLGLSLEGAF